mmetsp:Transcript_28800/g.54375  ORF Transcript_28800/g.54375 Transcript_28800/m.54375 type:complete len:245 (+) Transcript_28800:1328-2062(+)
MLGSGRTTNSSRSSPPLILVELAGLGRDCLENPAVKSSGSAPESTSSLFTLGFSSRSVLSFLLVGYFTTAINTTSTSSFTSTASARCAKRCTHPCTTCRAADDSSGTSSYLPSTKARPNPVSWTELALAGSRSSRIVSRYATHARDLATTNLRSWLRSPKYTPWRVSSTTQSPLPRNWPSKMKFLGSRSGESLPEVREYSKADLGMASQNRNSTHEGLPSPAPKSSHLVPGLPSKRLIASSDPR